MRRSKVYIPRPGKPPAGSVTSVDGVPSTLQKKQKTKKYDPEAVTERSILETRFVSQEFFSDRPRGIRFGPESNPKICHDLNLLSG